MQQKKREGGYMKKKIHKLPDFNLMTREEEASWFDKHDMGDYWDQFEDIDLDVILKKPRDETLVVRLQKTIKENMEVVAKRKGINVSTLARMWIIEMLCIEKIKKSHNNFH